MRTAWLIFMLAACDDGASSSADPSASNPSAPNPTSPSSASDLATPTDLALPQRTPVLINFDDLPTNTTITDQYAAHARFSSEPGVPITAEDWINDGQSPPNYLSAGSGNDVKHPLYVDFTKPVRNLKFVATGVTDRGTVAHVRVLGGSQLLSSVDLVGQGNDYQPVRIDLTALSDVTRIEVVDITDSYGIVYDDFSFDQ
jgi:hypothetical protein